MADINDILGSGEGDETLNLNELDEKEVLGDDEEEDHQNGGLNSMKQEETEDLYDEAMAPSGAIIEKRESAEIQSSLPSSVQIKSYNVSSSIKSEPGSVVIGSQSGKRFCCYIGNMTWWTTDEQLQKLIQSFGVEDLMDIKFYENRGNGQSKGFALAVFASEPSVKSVMEKLPSKKLHDQSLVVLPYTKQSLAKLEDATKRYDQKGGLKDEKVVNIGTVRIGTNGAPVPQLMSSINLAQLARPVSQAVTTQQQQQPTSLLSLNFPTPPIASRPPPTASAPATGLVVSAGSAMPATPSVAVAQQHQQQQQMAVAAAASLQQQLQQQQHSLLLQQQQQQQRQQQQQLAAVVASTPQLGLGGASAGAGGGGISVPPPNMVAAQQQQQVVAQQQAAQAALQSAMSRPPPAIHQSIAGFNTAAPPPTMTMNAGGALMAGYQQAPQARQASMHQQMTTMNVAGQQMMAQPVQAMQPPPGFPPGAHINPQVYPGYAGGFMDNGGAAQTMMSEAEFQEIMNRNQTVSSSAIHRAVSDAASGDYASAIETLVTAISLIRQSRVAHDDRCKLLINTLQDTLKGIEVQSYNGGGGVSRRRVRDRSRSPVRSSKRHRRSRSRSRSRDYSPMRYASSSVVSSRRY